MTKINNGNQPNSSNEVPPGILQGNQIGDEINLIDLVYPIYKHRRFLILFCLLVVVLTFIITRQMPKTFEATALILPQTRDGNPGDELKAAFLQQFGLSGLGGSATTPMAVLLESKELDRAIQDRYNYSLMGYGMAYSVIKSKSDSITVHANDPIMASDIANTYILELDRFNRTNTITSAQRLRKYIETRLVDVNRDLEQAQEDLRRFQEKNRAISISKQAEATLKVLSELEADRVAIEVEKAAKKKFYKGPHFEIEQLDAKMEALRKNIDRLTYSKEPKVPVERNKGKVDFYIPLKRVPALNFNESRLLLKVKAKTSVVTLLTTQLEQAKLDEAKDMPTIKVLDWAEPSGTPIKPNLKMNLMMSAVVSFFVGIFFIFLLEFIQKMSKDSESSSKWQEIRKGLINPFRFLFGKSP